MRVTGIVRRIDDLGRVVIPKEIRRSLNIREGDPLEMYIDETGVYFKKIISRDITDFTKALDDFINSECEKSEEIKSIAYALQMVLKKEIQNKTKTKGKGEFI